MKRLSFVFRAGISIGLLTLLVWLMRHDFRDVTNALSHTDKAIFAFAFILFMGMMFIGSQRLKLALKVQDININFYKAVYLSLIGLFFNNFLPTSIGGDLMKAYYASRPTKKIESFSAVFVDRFMGFGTLSIMAIISLFFLGNAIKNRLVVWMVMALFFGLITIAIVFTNRTLSRGFSGIFSMLSLFAVKDKMKRVYEAINTYKTNKILLSWIFFISIVAQAVWIACVWLLARSLNINISILLFFLFMPLIATLSMLPSLNGLGIRESSFVYFLGPIIGQEKAFALSLLALFQLWMASFIGGILYLFRDRIIDN